MKIKAIWKRVTAAAIACAIAVTGIGVVASGAQTTYSISGQVTYEGGNPAAAAVKAQAYSLQWDGSAWTWQPTGSPANVSSSGAYTITGLYPGNYRVGFSDDNNEYLPKFYQNASTVESATTVTIVNRNVTGINQQLEANPWYKISGSVSATSGDWADAEISAVLYKETTPTVWQPVADAVVSKVGTYTGTYTIEGVRPGTYRIGFFDASRVYATRFYQSVTTSVGAATNITVTATDVVGIDETLTARPQRKISGRVSFVGAAPVLGDVRAYVYSQDASGTWKVDFTSVVATDGAYSVHLLQDKTYRIGFVDSEDVFAPVFYTQASTVESATDIPISATSTPTATADVTMTAPASKRTVGVNAVDTAVKVSQSRYPTGKGGTVVVCSASSPYELAVAAPYARLTESPLLLVRKSSVSDEVIDEIGRLDADEVVVIGSPSVVSFEVEQALREAGVPVVRRLGGTSRYAVSAAVAQELMTRGLLPVDADGKLQGVYVVGDKSPWDAVIAGPLAASAERPLLLVRQNRVSAAVQDFLESNAATTTEFTIVGNAANVSEDVVSLLLRPGADPEAVVDWVGAEAPNRGALSVQAAEYAIGNLDFSSRKVALCVTPSIAEAGALGSYLATARLPLLVTGPELVRRPVPDSPGAYTRLSPAVEVYISKQTSPDLDPSGEQPRNFNIAYIEGIGQMDSDIWVYATRVAKVSR